MFKLPVRAVFASCLLTSWLIPALSSSHARTVPGTAAAPSETQHPGNEPGRRVNTTLHRSAGGVDVITFNPAELARAAATPAAFIIRSVPLPSAAAAFDPASPPTIDLELQRFSPLVPGARLVVGSLNGPDRDAHFDPSQILMFRGRVVGHPGSSVFLSLSPTSTVGRIDLGAGAQRLLISARGGSKLELAPGELALFPASARGGVALDVPACGVTPPPGWIPTPPPPPAPGDRDNDPIRGLRQIELAVDSDYELFEIFGNTEDTLTYIIQLYGQVSDIYMRDVNARVDLTYIRVWDNPADLFNFEDPLGQFQSYWETNMKSVPRDVAQLFLGSRLLSAGGVAYAPALCNSSSYSWAGYALGYFADPDRPDWACRDIMVTAHELGHNCGTFHTHDYNLDNCDDALSRPQRGSIMAYCGQTYSGGDANHDLWFHEYTASVMRSYMASRGCIALDCNQNHQPDSQDIALGFSLDLNANGVPDECEDCNNNGVLDALDISSGASPDVDADGLPDECQPDCNANGVPDRYDIQLGLSVDLNFNRIPDECEPDVDSSGQSDHIQISADMTLDIDRNLVPDAFQDCDADGITDLAALDHSFNPYVATTSADASVREFFTYTGVLMHVGSPGLIQDGQDLVITPARRVLVSCGSQNRVAELDRAGNYLRDLVLPGASGLSSPAAMLVRPEQNTVLVVSRGNASVLEFSLVDGALVRTVVAPGTGGMSSPFGLAIREGKLYLSTAASNVLEFDFATGALLRELVPPSSGILSDPRGILFKPDGNLLVASRGSNRINEYDGTTGAFIRKWNRNGTNIRLTLDEPWCLRIGPGGDVYVTRNRVTREGHDGGNDDDGHDGDDDHVHDDADTYIGGPMDLHLTDARVYQFDIRNGNMVRAYIIGSDTGLYRPTGIDFMPDAGTDCNRNQIPDVCDLASGASLDLNHNGILDECEPDCPADFDGTGFVDTDDFDAFVHAFEAGTPDADIDHSGFVDTDDFDAFVFAYESGC